MPFLQLLVVFDGSSEDKNCKISKTFEIDKIAPFVI